MKAVVTVVGKDKVGILAGVSRVCSESGMNIVEVTQSILQNMFAMVMMVEDSGKAIPFPDFVDAMQQMGEASDLQIHVMHEDIFNSMHRI